MPISTEELRQQDQESKQVKRKDEDPSAHRKYNFRLYLSTLKIFRWKITAVLVLAIVVALLETAQPRLIGDVVDKVLSNPAVDTPNKQQRLLH